MLRAVAANAPWYNSPVFATPSRYRTFAILFGLFLLGLIVYGLRTLLWPMFFAWLLAYMLDPLVDRLERLRIPRALSIGILLCCAITLLTLFVLLALPPIVRDFFALGRALYEAFTGLLKNLGPWLRAHRIAVPSDAQTALGTLSSKAFGWAPSALGPVGGAIEAAVGSTASVLGVLGNVVMVPVFSFYFLYDFDRMIAAMRELVPGAYRPLVVALASEVNTVLGHFVRGQLTVMAILAVLYATGYALVGVPLAVPIGVIAGLLSFIPYVGSGVALAFGLLMVGLHFESIGQVIGVVVVYAIVQLLEGFVITPRVVGGKLGLSPIWVLFALLAFGHLFGFVGVMLALPASAVIKVFVMHGLVHYRSSALYLDEPRAVSGPTRPARLRLRPNRRDRHALRIDR